MILFLLQQMRGTVAKMNKWVHTEDDMNQGSTVTPQIPFRDHTVLCALHHTKRLSRSHQEMQLFCPDIDLSSEFAPVCGPCRGNIHYLQWTRCTPSLRLIHLRNIIWRCLHRMFLRHHQTWVKPWDKVFPEQVMWMNWKKFQSWIHTTLW